MPQVPLSVHLVLTGRVIGKHDTLSELPLPAPGLQEATAAQDNFTGVCVEHMSSGGIFYVELVLADLGAGAHVEVDQLLPSALSVVEPGHGKDWA
jgi:hypothetical protein